MTAALAARLRRLVPARVPTASLRDGTATVEYTARNGKTYRITVEEQS